MGVKVPFSLAEGRFNDWAVETHLRRTPRGVICVSPRVDLVFPVCSQFARHARRLDRARGGNRTSDDQEPFLLKEISIWVGFDLYRCPSLCSRYFVHEVGGLPPLIFARDQSDI